MEKTSRLEYAIAQLHPQSRRVMELWLEGMSYSEIAQTLGFSERTVTVIRNSSIWKLRELIARQPSPENATFTLQKAK